MKNFKFLFLFAAILGLTFTSCSDDPDPIITIDSPVIENLKNGIMDGKLEEDYTLDSGISYTLSGSFLVEDGITLTIPGGTQITAATGGVDIYIAVLQGGKIYVNTFCCISKLQYCRSLRRPPRARGRVARRGISGLPGGSRAGRGAVRRTRR